MRIHKAHQITLLDAPVVADAPAPTVSPRYTFVPTRDIVEGLTGRGWVFDSGTARGSRNPERAPFATHVLRFSNPALPRLADGSRPQAVVINSHGGDGAFQLRFGVFRLACANGLVIESVHAAAIRRRHVGLTTGAILEAADELLERAPAVFRAVNDWALVDVSPDKALELADRCGRVRWSEGGFDPSDLLKVRRYADHGNDLWRVYNRVQEAVIHGGVPITRPATPERPRPVVRMAGAIRGALRDVEINRDLWRAAEEVAFGA